MDPVKHIVYVSSAAHSMRYADLQALQKQCEGNNRKLNITGVLMYRNGQFIGVIEGSEQNVDHLFNDKILLDARHRGIDVLRTHFNGTRMFSTWSMKYRWLRPISKSTEQNILIEESIISEEQKVLGTEHAETRYILSCFYKSSKHYGSSAFS